MIVFVSDVHFGRGSPDETQAVERELIDCLEVLKPRTEKLYLLGDIFDQYIEYRHLIPKGQVRFQALLARWTDDNIPVNYLLGNRDPWHRDYFRSELGVQIIPDTLHTNLYGRNVLLAHGDGHAPTNFIYNRIKQLLRHPVPVTLYRNVLPGDMGYQMANWFNRTFGNKDPDPSVAQDLRSYARTRLADDDLDAVILGHSHIPEHRTFEIGEYLNPGAWYRSRTFGVLTNDGFALKKWNGSETVLVENDL